MFYSPSALPISHDHRPLHMHMLSGDVRSDCGTVDRAMTPLTAPISINLNSAEHGPCAVHQMEPNPDFVEKLREVGAGRKGVILMCEAGGTTRPTPSFQFGKASRSLTAAFR